MAIDSQAIVDQYYSGQAEILPFPVPPGPVYKDIYTPVKELPAEMRETFEYHPDKAKQLLAEAGYPNGFETELVCYDTQADLVSLLAAYWAKVGVKMKLNVMERNAHQSFVRNKKHTTPIITGRGFFTPYEASDWQPGQYKNYSNIDDPYINERVKQMWSFDYLTRPAERAEIMKELAVYSIGQAYNVIIPLPYLYFGWWPWVQNYHGEDDVGGWNYYGYPIWVWYDQNMKKEMGY